MVTREKLSIVLIAALLTVLGLLLVTGNERVESKSFVGLCVYSGEGFSVLTDGERTVGVYASLELGKVYRVEGIPFNSTSGLKIRPERVYPSTPTFPLDSITGAYWLSGVSYLLTPAKVRLALPLPADKGELVRVSGLWYGEKFYPVNHTRLGFPKKPSDDMPWAVEGVVLYSGGKTILWNGSEEVVLYLPYGAELKLGQRVRVVGIVRFYSKLSLFVDSPADVVVTGTAEKKPLRKARVGDVAVGNCTAVSAGRSLGLDCTELRLYGFSARVGDSIHFEALWRRSSLICLNCTVTVPREELPNDICSFSPGEFARISGNVSWVRVYKNGFGIANVTSGRCWVLLKLRKSLGVSVRANQTVTAYGFFTTYRDMPAFEVKSGDDLCSGSC
ncbi:hypothetical protein [Thermococcus pacificus]|uniref:Uncharacterized protein n=1 Tax=Thermococcus pacificus TaxID=71998 RepID=A0A218P6C3_9EURY|nr:hypothetical protein [Thermococcus pacificus]ASJ06324.1 hypothetical protein A3L08_02740 [Thermococcus pacificus]